MSGFSVDWLTLREEADLRSRDFELLEKVDQWLRDHCAKELIVADLGAGTGSTMRAFANFVSQKSESISWRLIDQDSDLLEYAHNRHCDSYRIETFDLDLNNTALLPLQSVQLITASALLDLVSEEFVDSITSQLVSLNKQQPVGLYTALTYNGMIEWKPSHSLDEKVQNSLNQDQKRDKGFGKALGPDASEYLGQRLTEAGFKVYSADSTWFLDAVDEKLVIEYIAGIDRVLENDQVLGIEALKAWVEFRESHVTTGACRVGHCDLLALPPG